MTFFCGFDKAFPTDSFANQFNLTFGDESTASLVPGRGYGEALRLVSNTADGDSIFQLYQSDSGGDSGFGFRFNANIASEPNIVFGHFKFPAVGDFNMTNLLAANPSSTDAYYYYIQDNQLLYQRGYLDSPKLIANLEVNKWYYIESRWRSSSTIQTYIRGLLRLSTSSGGVPSRNYIVMGASPQGIAFDYDDIYAGNVAIDILASGKVPVLALTDTVYNDWTVINSATAHEALSDSDDSTYIETQSSASAQFNVSPSAAATFGINVIFRGKDTDGIGTLEYKLSASPGGSSPGYVVALNTDYETITHLNVDEFFNTSSSSWTEVTQNLRIQLWTGAVI